MNTGQGCEGQGNRLVLGLTPSSNPPLPRDHLGSSQHALPARSRGGEGIGNMGATSSCEEGISTSTGTGTGTGTTTSSKALVLPAAASAILSGGMSGMVVSWVSTCLQLKKLGLSVSLMSCWLVSTKCVAATCGRCLMLTVHVRMVDGDVACGLG